MVAAPRAWAALTTGTIASIAVLETIPHPESFWPTSWVALMTAITVTLTAITLIVTRIMGLHRWGQKGIYDRLDKLTEAAQQGADSMRAEMRAMKEHFDSELVELQDHYDKEINEIRQDTDEKLNRFTIALKERMDGFGIRVERQESEVLRIQGEQRTSAEDRRHINQKLDRIEVLVDRMLQLMGPHPR